MSGAATRMMGVATPMVVVPAMFVVVGVGGGGQAGREIVFVSSVTAPLEASSRP